MVMEGMEIMEAMVVTEIRNPDARPVVRKINQAFPC